MGETERRLWKIDGIISPPFKSEDEKRWREEDKPSEWSGGRKSVKTTREETDWQDAAAIRWFYELEVQRCELEVQRCSSRVDSR